MLALSYGYNTIQILDTSTWRELNKKVIDPRSNCRITLQWSNDSRQLMTSPFIGWIHILDINTLKPITKIAIPGDRDDMYGFSFLYASFRNKIAVAEEKKPIRIFDLESGQLQIEFSEATSYVSGLSFSPDGTLLVSWSQDSSVCFWEAETGRKLARIHEYSLRVIEPVYPSFHPFKPILVTFCDKRRSMRIWDIDYETLLG
jgi:WD40 repeat protein